MFPGPFQSMREFTAGFWSLSGWQEVCAPLSTLLITYFQATSLSHATLRVTIHLVMSDLINQYCVFGKPIKILKYNILSKSWILPACLVSESGRYQLPAAFSDSDKWWWRRWRRLLSGQQLEQRAIHTTVTRDMLLSVFWSHNIYHYIIDHIILIMSTTDQVTDPLRTIDNDEAEDLFKSAFNGSAGVLKITNTSPQIDSYQGLSIFLNII